MVCVAIALLLFFGPSGGKALSLLRSLYRSLSDFLCVPRCTKPLSPPVMKSLGQLGQAVPWAQRPECSKRIHREYKPRPSARTPTATPSLQSCSILWWLPRTLALCSDSLAASQPWRLEMPSGKDFKPARLLLRSLRSHPRHRYTLTRPERFSATDTIRRLVM